jgi:hypothetical protein
VLEWQPFREGLSGLVAVVDELMSRRTRKRGTGGYTHPLPCLPFLGNGNFFFLVLAIQCEGVVALLILLILLKLVELIKGLIVYLVEFGSSGRWSAIR